MQDTMVYRITTHSSMKFFIYRCAHTHTHVCICIYTFFNIYIHTHTHIYVCFAMTYLPMQYIKIHMVKLKL